MNQNIEITEKHSLILRVCHWLNVSFLSLMIWSGNLIYWANQAYIKIPDMLGPFQVHHRLAEGMGWHFFVMWFLVINGLIYISYLVFSGSWREILPDRKAFKDLIPFILFDLKIKKDSPVIVGKFNPAQKFAYSGVIFLGALAVLSGLAIYKPIQLHWLCSLLGGYEGARFVHFLSMLGIVIFIPLHLIQVLRAGWNNFRGMVAGYEIQK